MLKKYSGGVLQRREMIQLILRFIPRHPPFSVCTEERWRAWSIWYRKVVYYLMERLVNYHFLRST